ncbi:MAG: hypothetical protein ACPHPA_01045 [Cycloclasticus pugetii]|uniref:hypothetical protein n=1 Tax=Cycloclasticus pugetii TaxID=34068 RepID=UPI003A95D1F4
MNTIIYKYIYFLALLFLFGCSDNQPADNSKNVSIQNNVEDQKTKTTNGNNTDAGIGFYGIDQNLQRYCTLVQINDQNV